MALTDYTNVSIHLLNKKGLAYKDTEGVFHLSIFSMFLCHFRWPIPFVLEQNISAVVGARMNYHINEIFQERCIFEKEAALALLFSQLARVGSLMGRITSEFLQRLIFAARW